MVRRRPVVLVAAVAVTVSVLLSACSGAGSPSSQGADDTGFVSVNGVNEKSIAPADRTAAPDLTGKKVGGGQLALSDYRGRIVVLNVWGSWCAPCRGETPSLVASAKELGKQNVAFVGLNTRDNEAAAAAFTSAYKVPYPSFYDPDGDLLLQLRDSISPKGIPSTLVIDPQGRVAAAVLGRTTQTALSEVVGKVLLESVRSSATASASSTAATP